MWAIAPCSARSKADEQWDSLLGSRLHAGPLPAEHADEILAKVLGIRLRRRRVPALPRLPPHRDFQSNREDDPPRRSTRPENAKASGTSRLTHISPKHH